MLSLSIVRAGLTIREPHTNVRRGPFSHTRTQDFLSRGALFFYQKGDNPFLVVSERQHSVVKNWQLIGGPLAAGVPSHGTTLSSSSSSSTNFIATQVLQKPQGRWSMSIVIR